jgi:ABC-type transporter Mla subunit MlaD
MSTEDVPKIVQVPVKRYDVNLTLDDILTPLTQLGARRAQERATSAEGATSAASSEIDQHLQQLSDLARQLKDVISRINQADPTVLAPTSPKQPPIA